MILTQTQFQEKFDANTLRIAFIGMSNIGKSTRTEQFCDKKKFTSFSVDNHIEDALNLESMEAMARWMGYPFESQFHENQNIYLEHEGHLTQNCGLSDTGNFILDTTGSVIYLTPEIHKFLSENFLVIALDVSESMLKEMTEEFFLTPKSIVWGDAYNRNPKETEVDSLRRCYPKLLKDRVGRYRNLADIIIPGEVSRSPEIDVDRFWEILKLSLPQ